MIDAAPKRCSAGDRLEFPVTQAAEHGSIFRFIARVAFGRALRGISGVGPIPELPADGAIWKAKRATRRRSEVTPEDIIMLGIAVAIALVPAILWVAFRRESSVRVDHDDRNT